MASGLFQRNFLSKPPPDGSTYPHHSRNRSDSSALPRPSSSHQQQQVQHQRSRSTDRPHERKLSDPQDPLESPPITAITIEPTDINRDIDHIKELLTLVGPQSTPSGFAQHAFPRMFRAHISQRRIFEELEILRLAVLKQRELGSRPGTPGSSVAGLGPGQQVDLGSLDDIPEAELAGQGREEEVRLLRERGEVVEREFEVVRKALAVETERGRKLEATTEELKAEFEQERKGFLLKQTDADTIRDQERRQMGESHATEVQTLKDTLEKQKIESERSQTTMQEAHDSKLKTWEHQMLQELSTLKSNLESRVKDLERSHESQRSELEKSHNEAVRKAKRDHQVALDNVASKHSQSLSDKDSTLKSQRQKHEEQVNTLHASHAAKRKDLSDTFDTAKHEHALALERLKTEHASKLRDMHDTHHSELETTKSDAQDAVERVQREHEQTRTQQSELVQTLEAQKRDHATAMEQLRDKHATEQQDAKSSYDKRNLEATQSHEFTLQRIKEEYEHEKQKLRSQHQATEQELLERGEAKAKELQASHDEKLRMHVEQSKEVERSLSNKHQGELHQLRNEYGASKKQYEVEIDNLRKEHQAKLEKASQNAADGINKVHESHDHELRNVKDQHQRQIKSLKSEHDTKLKEAEAALASTKGEGERQLQERLEKQRLQHANEMKSAATAHEETQEAYKRQLEDQKQQHETALNSAAKAHEKTQAAHKREIEELKSRHEQEVDDKDNEHDERIRTMQEASKSSSDKLKQQHTRRTEELQQEHAAKLKSAEEATERKTKEHLQAHAHEIEAVEQSYRLESEKLRQELKAKATKQLEVLKKDHEAELQKTRHEAEDSRNELQKKLDSALRESQDKADAVQKDHRATLDKIQEEHDGEKLEAKRNHDSRMTEMKESHVKELTARQARIAEHESSIASLRQDQQNLRQEHNDALSRAKQESQAQFRAFQADHDERYAEVQSAHEDKVKETSAAIENLTRQLNDKEKRTVNFQAASEEQRGKLLAEIDELKVRSRRDYETAARRHDEELQTLRESHQKDLNAAKAEAKTRMADLRKSHYQTLTAMQENDHDNTSQVAELEKKLNDQEKHHLQKLGESAKEAKSQAQREHEEQMTQVKNAHEEALKRKEEEVTSQLEQRFMSQLTQVRKSLDGTLASTEAKGREAGSSEARAELLSEINSLRHDYDDELAQKEKELSDLREHFEDYKSKARVGEREASMGERAPVGAKDVSDDRADVETLRDSLNDMSKELSQLQKKLDFATEKRRHAEKVRDALLARYSSLPQNTDDHRRARSEQISREVMEEVTLSEDLKAQLSNVLKQNEELRAGITELRASRKANERSAELPQTPQHTSRPVARTRQSNMTSPPVLQSQADDNEYSQVWPQKRDMLAARERLVSDYKTKLHRVLREKASLETNFTAKYMQELASAKAELVDQHRASIQSQLQLDQTSPGQDDSGVIRRNNHRLSQQHLDTLDKTESRLTTEYEQRAAHLRLSANPLDDEDKFGGDEDQPFQHLVAEYDARIIALLSEDAEGARLADDLSIRPERFEALAMDYGRRSLDVERPRPTPPAAGRRKLSHDASTELAPNRTSYTWSAASNDRRNRTWDAQRASVRSKESGQEKGKSTPVSGSGSGATSVRGRATQRVVLSDSPTTQSTPLRSNLATSAPLQTSPPPSSPPNGHVNPDSEYWVRRKGESARDFNPESYTSTQRFGVESSKYNPAASNDHPSAQSSNYMTRNPSGDHVAEPYRPPQRGSKSVEIARILPAPNGTASRGNGRIGDSKWNSGIDARLEQAHVVEDGADSTNPELYMHKQRSKHSRRQSEGVARPKTAPGPESAGIYRKETDGLAEAREKEQEKASRQGKEVGSKRLGIRERVRSLAERQSRARYVSEGATLGKGEGKR